MAFIREEITGPEDLAFFHSLHLIRTATDEPLEPFMWTVDRQRNLYLISTGGSPYEHSEIPATFVFVWNHTTVEIWMHEKTKDLLDGCAVSLVIEHMEIPRRMKAETDDIIAELIEAFEVHIVRRNPTIRRVGVESIAQPIYIDDDYE